MISSVDVAELVQHVSCAVPYATRCPHITISLRGLKPRLTVMVSWVRPSHYHFPGDLKPHLTNMVFWVRPPHYHFPSGLKPRLTNMVSWVRPNAQSKRHLDTFVRKLMIPFMLNCVVVSD